MFSGGRSPYSAYPELQFQPAGAPPPERQQRPTGYYDPPSQQIYPRETAYYHRSPNLPVQQPLRDPSSRKFQVIYYDPNDPHFRPPARAPAPLPAPVPLPSLPGSYIELPSGSSQMRPGESYTVVAVEENNYRSPAGGPRVNYEYRGGGGGGGGYNDYQRGYGGHYPY